MIRGKDFLLVVLILVSGCGGGESRVNPEGQIAAIPQNEPVDPAGKPFTVSESFENILIMLSGQPSAECTRNLIEFIAREVSVTGEENVAEVLDAKMEIEMKEICTIKRKSL